MNNKEEIFIVLVAHGSETERVTGDVEVFGDKEMAVEYLVSYAKDYIQEHDVKDYDYEFQHNNQYFYANNLGEDIVITICSRYI